MNWLKKTWRFIADRVYGVALEEDRAVQEAITCRGVDDTISGTAAVYPALKPLKVVLDATLPGGPHGKHSENAAFDDDAQQKALDQAEGSHV